jgi:hypothetical protein
MTPAGSATEASHSVIVRRLEDGSVSQLASIVKTVSPRTRERRPSPSEEKCSSSPSRRKYDQAAATAPKLGEERPSISPAST